jgi:phenylpyruvate tautomerase PptA (4-oxalocrotonate tautomerase family)
MPIIEIEALPPSEPFDVPAALTHVTAQTAAFLEEEPRGTWAILRPIPAGHFAEGADSPDIQPRATHPAIVRVFANRAPEEVAPLLEVIGRAVVEAFELDEGNVFVRCELADPDLMFWG